MVSMRVHCFLLIFFIVQLLHAKFSNANFNSQVHQSENSEGFRASTITQISNKDIEGISKNRKMLKQRNPKIKRNDKNGLEIESEELVKKRNKKKLTKTVSLMADYTDATHHPPRHN